MRDPYTFCQINHCFCFKLQVIQVLEDCGLKQGENTKKDLNKDSLPRDPKTMRDPRIEGQNHDMFDKLQVLDVSNHSSLKSSVLYLFESYGSKFWSH